MTRYVRFVWTDWNVDHIARHGVSRQEAEEVVEGGRFSLKRLRGDRYRIIGQTAAGRYLTVIADRQANGGFFVVTARPADSEERRAFLRQWDRR